jgi:O-antigen/teichoic acid export membrane protein
MAETYTLNRRFVVKNIAALFSGTALAQALTAIVYLVLARHLGATVYGVFAACLAFASLTSLLFNLGLEVWLLQAGGKNPQAIKLQAGSILLIKVVLGLAWLAGLALVQPWLNQQTFPRDVFILTALVVLLDSLFLTTLAAFKASLQNRYIFYIEPTTDVIWLGGTLLLIGINTTELLPFLWLRGLVLVGGLAAALVLVRWKIGLGANRSTIRQAMRESPPYFASELFAAVTMRMDLLLVALFLGSQAAGIYSPALAVINATFFIPAAIANVMIPVLSQLNQGHPIQARLTARRQILLQGAVGVAMFGGFLLLSPLVARFLGESFEGTGILLQILSLILLVKPITFSLATILVASGNQDKRVAVQIIAVAATLALDLIAVTWFGLPAVALVYVLVEGLLLAGYGWQVYRHTPVLSRAQAPGTSGGAGG